MADERVLPSLPKLIGGWVPHLPHLLPPSMPWVIEGCAGGDYAALSAWLPAAPTNRPPSASLPACRKVVLQEQEAARPRAAHRQGLGGADTQASRIHVRSILPQQAAFLACLVPWLLLTWHVSTPPWFPPFCCPPGSRCDPPCL